MVPDRADGGLRAGRSGGVRRRGPAARRTGHGLRGAGAPCGAGPRGGDGAGGGAARGCARAGTAVAAGAVLGQDHGHGGRAVRTGRGRRGRRARTPGPAGVARLRLPDGDPDIAGPRPPARHPTARWRTADRRGSRAGPCLGAARHGRAVPRGGPLAPGPNGRVCRATCSVRRAHRRVPGGQAPAGGHENRPGVRTAAGLRGGLDDGSGGRRRRQGRGGRGRVRGGPDRTATTRRDRLHRRVRPLPVADQGARCARRGAPRPSAEPSSSAGPAPAAENRPGPCGHLTMPLARASVSHLGNSPTRRSYSSASDTFRGS